MTPTPKVAKHNGNRPRQRKRDVVENAVEVGKIATKQQADPFAPKFKDTMLYQLCEEEKQKDRHE